jgi:hypothetical protein
VSEKGILRSRFGPKREKVTGGCREMNKDEFPNSHYSPNIIRGRMKEK